MESKKLPIKTSIGLSSRKKDNYIILVYDIDVRNIIYLMKLIVDEKYMQNIEIIIESK